MIRLLSIIFMIIFYSCSGGVTTEYRSAKTYVGQQNYEKAEQIALEGIKNNPEDALTPYYLALNIYGAPNSPKKDYKKTGEYFNLALKIDNKDEVDQLLPEPIPALNKDNQMIDLITIKDAISHYRYRIWAEIYNNSIELIQKQNNQAAIDQLNIASSVYPQNALTYDMLSRLFFESNNFSQAIKNANQALSIDNSLTDLLTLKAEIEKSKGDNIKAEEYLQEAYNIAIINGETPERLTNHMASLFDVLFTNGKKNEALRLSEKLIENDPENVILYSNAGALYQNILLDEQSKANESLSSLSNFSEQQLEDIKVIFQDCIELAKKARENFLMCNQLELDEEKSEQYYQEAKRLKQIQNELKSQIRKINKQMDEL